MLIGVNFHYVRPGYDHPYPSFFGLTPREFAERLDLLAGIGEFVSAAQVRAASRGAETLPERAWLVTFDDGLREQYDHAWPILRDKGIPALFFVNTDPIANHRMAAVHKIHQLRSQVAPERVLAAIAHHGAQLDIPLPEVDPDLAARQYKYDTPEAARLKYLLNIRLSMVERERLVDACFADLMPAAEDALARSLYMDPAQVAELAAHGCIGTHAHEHLPLGTLPGEEIRRQVALSLEHLAAWTPEEIYALSYPYGAPEACSLAAGEIAAEQGIELGFTMERAGNADFAAPLFLARCDNNDLPGGKAARWGVDEVFDRIPAARWHRDAVAPEVTR